jgi:hypothetical protein
MSRLPLVAVVLGLVATGCGSDNSTTPSPTQPTRLVFTAQLSALNEVPALAANNAEIGGRGTATVTFNVTRDAAGNITAGTVDVSATFTGFPPGTSVSLAHIHRGDSATGGAVVIGTVPSAGEVTMPNGTGSYVHGGFPIGPPVDIANEVIANPAGFYFNVHTPTNPGGALRGQLVRVP